MKIKEEIIGTKKYSLQCIKCGKRIKGTSEDHVRSNFKTHFDWKHKVDKNA